MTGHIIQRISLSCHWQKPTLYREYHCPVIDKNLHYTENITVLSLIKTYIIHRIPLSCHWQKPTLYREYHCPVTDKNQHYTENITVLSLIKTYIIQRISLSCLYNVGLSATEQWYSLYTIGCCQWQDSDILCIMYVFDSDRPMVFSV
jgi:prepilin signal peptidase PulO-like enzyme (type II secretory pathway)